MINQKWWKSIKNCRSFNTVDIMSDHKIVAAKFHLSLRKAKTKSNTRSGFMTEKLADERVRLEFDLELQNQFNVLFDEASALDPTQARTDSLNLALEITCEKLLGKRPKRKQPSWVSNHTLKLIDEQGKAKVKQSQLEADKNSWRHLQSKVSESFTRDQNLFEEQQLKALELADQKHESGTIWKIIEKMTKKPQVPAASKVRMLDGSIPKDSCERLSEWCKYFSDLLNNKNPNFKASNRPTPAQIDDPSIPKNNIGREEVVQAIKDLKRGKSPGPDYAMTAEVLKDGGKFLVDQLTIICQLVYRNKKAPSQWTSSLIIPLPKKGNLELMTNFRGIILMLIAAKVFNRVLLNRIRKPIDVKLRKNQAGFRTGRSCVQQIHILRRIMEGACYQKIPLYITFVDFMKAFDSIDRDMMFSILRHYGIPEPIVEAIRTLYTDSSSRVYIEGTTSEPFKITTGVLQGDVLAPFLFIIVIDYISCLSAGNFGYLTHKAIQRNNPRTARSNSSVVVTASERKLNDLAFADDVALLENTIERAQEQLDAFKNSAATVGLRLNTKKTEQIQLNVHQGTTFTKLVSENQEIAVVDDFKYLGSYVGSTEKDVNARIALAWVAFNKLRPILKAPRPTVKFKMRLFNAACVSVLLYGCETWVLTETLSKKLDVFARTCYRIMLRINQSEAHMKNEELYRKCAQRPIRELVRERQLKFVGHCLRMDKEEPANIYVLYKSEVGKNPVGRPRETYLDQISRHISEDKRAKLSAEEIARKARDKSEWYHVVAPHKPAR